MDDMTDQERRERLQSGLDGDWEYICHVTSETPFVDGERGRGGYMTFMVTLPWTGVHATIRAERLWKTKDPGDAIATREPLRNPIPWEAVGAVVFTENGIYFEYMASEVDGRGATRDSFRIEQEGRELSLGMGKFSHVRADERKVVGTVRLRKMSDGRDFKFAPEGIRPGGHSTPTKSDTASGEAQSRTSAESAIITNAGVVILGPVSGGAVTGTANNITLASGDLHALEAALTAMQISREDVCDITKIVKEEQPKSGTLGTRAADWVGKMVVKSITGTWEFGKGVSSKILTEMLLRFYGWK